MYRNILRYFILLSMLIEIFYIEKARLQVFDRGQCVSNWHVDGCCLLDIFIDHLATWSPSKLTLRTRFTSHYRVSKFLLIYISSLLPFRNVTRIISRYYSDIKYYLEKSDDCFLWKYRGAVKILKLQYDRYTLKLNALEASSSRFFITSHFSFISQVLYIFSLIPSILIRQFYL